MMADAHHSWNDIGHASLLAIGGGSRWHMVPTICRGSVIWLAAIVEPRGRSFARGVRAGAVERKTGRWQ
jgi:hypothetical protein